MYMVRSKGSRTDFISKLGNTTLKHMRPFSKFLPSTEIYFRQRSGSCCIAAVKTSLDAPFRHWYIDESSALRSS